MTGQEIRAKRAAEGIDGHTLCARIGRCRSWLSDFELSRITVEPAEMQRVSDAIDQIVSERAQIAELAEKHGLSLVSVGY